MILRHYSCAIPPHNNALCNTNTTLETIRLKQYIRNMKNVFLFFLLITIALPSFSLPFNEKLSHDNVQALEKGEIISRNIGKYKNISIQGDNAGITRIKEEIKNLNPNYLVELTQIRPYKGNEDLAQKLRSILEDIPSYAGIQYWSVQHERYYDLYKTAEVIEKQTLDEKTTRYIADLFMEPFSTIHSIITLEQTDDYLLYTMENTNNLKFNDKILCVNKNNMKSAILLFRDGDNWIIYGLGGCKALKIAIFEERIERSFINRIKTFCNYIYEKI